MIEMSAVLIESFLEGKTTEKESEQVAAFLSRNPDILKEFLHKSWERAGNQPAVPSLIPPRDEMLESIRLATGIEVNERTILSPRVWAIAATALCLIGLFSLMKFTFSNSKTMAPVVEIQPVPWKQIKWTNLQNTEDAPMTIALDDGSTVLLQPGSTISYNDSFNISSRQLYLKGEGVFTVAKDPQRPFTVSTDLFATTALGTIFSVKESNNACKVKLYEGKVVIQSTRFSPVYLLPGQQLSFDLSGNEVAVAPFKDAIGKRSVSKSGKNAGAIVFENTDLIEVFERLSSGFNVRIAYQQNDLAGRYFSGTVLVKDSLPVILKVIAQMNALSVAEQDGGYIITKPN